MKKLIYIIILLMAHCTLIIEDCNSQWYQVNLPIASSIQRVQFVNQNTGWLIMYNLNLLKTTNSGINWAVATDSSKRIFDFQFINDTLGYGMATNTGGANLLLKTTNGGYNWTTMQSAGYALAGFYFVNADTGWVNAFTFPTQSTFMTTDGFQTLNLITTGVGGNPATIHFFKEPYNGGLCGYIRGAGYLWRTTNSGFNWAQLSFSEAGSVNSFSFINKDTGFVVYNPNVGNNTKILFTSNAGQNWSQSYYYDSNYGLGIIRIVNKDKIWCGGNYMLKSTNGGTNWGRQNCPILYPSSVYMIDTIFGFAWNTYQLVRTTNGGGAIIGINQISTEVPKEFSLGQNYPNPFNPTTNIPFELKEPSHLTLKVIDARGREVKELVNGRWGTGKFIADFDASALATGIYFYQIIISGESTHQTFAETRKMMVLK